MPVGKYQHAAGNDRRSLPSSTLTRVGLRTNCRVFSLEMREERVFQPVKVWQPGKRVRQGSGFTSVALGLPPKGAGGQTIHSR